jgi:hypothetical protein
MTSPRDPRNLLAWLFKLVLNPDDNDQRRTCGTTYWSNMIGGREWLDRVFLIVVLRGDGVFSELVSNLPRYGVVWHPRGFVLKTLKEMA